MKKLNILKALLDLFWIFGIFTIILLLFMLSFYFIGNGKDVPFRVKDIVITDSDIYSKIMVSISFICGLLFIYCIYLLRKVITYFQKTDIFNPEVIHLFNKIGKIIIFSSLLINGSLLAYKMYLNSNTDHKSDYSINLDLGGYDSFLISISLGLFFMVISEIFKIAKTQKEENDLTI